MLLTTEFTYRKGLDTCDALLCVAHTLQSALQMLKEARIVHIDFSAALDRVNHQGIRFQHCSVGVGGSVLSVLTQFLSNRSQYVMVFGCHCKLVNVVSGVPHGSVLCLLYTAELFSVVENKLYGYADNSTLVAVERVAVSESINRDLNRVSVWFCTPYRVARSAGFLAGGVFECNLPHRRSVAELCMLFKIKSNPMHPLKV